MKKVFVLAPQEDWVCDRIVKEWYDDNADVSTSQVRDADVVWLYSDWCWWCVPVGFLATKKVLVTVHHVVPDKFGTRERQEFLLRDRYTTAYHVPNAHTASFVKGLTDKPVHVIPYWANQRIWRPTGVKGALRKKHGLPEGGFLVGSFQRDTEGKDLRTPKLEKGPDLLADNLVRLAAVEPRLHVVLAGWRRQYLIGRLEAAGVPYSYIELPSQDVVNELYQTIDVYMVSSRHEGGPQALVECGLLAVPCVSRDVGIARQVLCPEAVNDDLWAARPAVPDVKGLTLPDGYQPYRDLVEAL